MCLNPGCWKRSSCEWVSCWVTTSILSVYAASFCCISVYTPYPGRQAGCSDSGSYSTLWVFLGGATGPSVFRGPGEFLLGIHIVFSPFKFFTLLELLMYFFSSAWWHFPSKQSSQLEAAKAQKSALAANFWGGVSTPYGFFLLIGMTPICSYIQVSRKHSFVCFFFLLPFLWIKPGRDLHTVLTARLVTCGWLEKNYLCAWRGNRMSNRWPFTWVIPQRSKSEVLLNVFPDDKNNGNRCLWGQIWKGRQQHEANAVSCPWGEIGPTDEYLGPNWVESSSAERELGAWQASWTQASNGLCQKGPQQAGLWVRPTASRPGMGSVPSVLLSRGCVWTALSILWLPNTRKTWNKSSGCHKNSLGLENITYRRKLKELGLFSLGKVLNICPCKARMTWSDDHCLKQTLGQRSPEIPPNGGELWCSDWNKHAKRKNSPGEDVLWIRCYLLSPRHVCVCRNWWDPEDLPPPL